MAGAIPPQTVRWRVAQARDYADLEQGELAELTGLSRASISNYEIGKSVPRRSSLIAIAFATGVDLTWLETGKTPGGDDPAGGGECAIRDSNPEPAD
jgi:transcriptional regulator with XRE-family HTH domain